MNEYDQITQWYAETRDHEIGIPELAELVRGLNAGAKILDLGCGNGIPMSKYLVDAGFSLIGLDGSQEMIARFQLNLPGVPARCERAQDATFETEAFDAVLAWGVMFHMGREDQRRVIANVSNWLKIGGRFLFTAGEASGTRKGEMDGVAFSYVSLGSHEYRKRLKEAGMALIAEYNDEWDNRVFLAEKQG